ncbi:MAG: chemotaxis protein CheW [Planctomycetota bacterium]
MFLLMLAAQIRCALPLSRVIETLRPLPVEPVREVGGVQVGLARIRGEPVPVLELAELLGAGRGAPTRLVTLRIGEGAGEGAGARRVALAVDAVLGLAELPLGDLPPLLRESPGLAGLTQLDAELVRVLDAGCLVPPEVWEALGAAGQVGAEERA